MIIFNFYAILIVLMTIVFSIPVYILNYFNVISEDLTVVLVCWILLISSFIGKRTGINGRLFFIPMWILSIPFALIVTFSVYGWIGILVTVGIFALPIAVGLFLSYNSEQKRAQEIDYAEIILPTKNDKPIDYWKKIKELFFFPSFAKFSPSVCNYNYKILEKMEAENIELKSLSDLKKELQTGKNSFDTEVKINSDLKNNFLNEIDDIIAHLQELESKKSN